MEQSSRDRWHELWGTFSVEDHCRRGAFVAEVLLYDKLLIPVLPTVEDGLEPYQAALEAQRWAKWDPQRQKEILAILGKRAEQIAWTAERHDEWQSEMRKSFADARRDGYFMTGQVLQRFAPAMARSVVAVSRYHSLEELESAGIRRRRPSDKVTASTLLAVLGHELLLPDDPERDDLEVLREAVTVSFTPEYRLRRRALFEWQQDFLNSDNLTDAASIRAAVTQMEDLVDRLKSADDRQKKWKWAKRFFSFMGVAAKGGALGGPVLALSAAGAGAIAALGTFVVDEASAGHLKPDPSLPAATLILDARDKLGIK